MKNIIIVGSGEDYSIKKLIDYCANADYIIASDGGAKTLVDNNIKPNLIVGDFDSIDDINDKKYSEIKKIEFPKDKDLTDSEISLKMAIDMNPENIFMFCMTGSYIDHSLGNLYNLLRNLNENIYISLITSNSEIFIIKSCIKLRKSLNRRFSLFPLENIYGLEISGSQYKFDKSDIKITDYSISNIFIIEEPEIKFDKGTIICIIFDSGYN